MLPPCLQPDWSGTLEEDDEGQGSGGSQGHTGIQVPANTGALSQATQSLQAAAQGLSQAAATLSGAYPASITGQQQHSNRKGAEAPQADRLAMVAAAAASAAAAAAAAVSAAASLAATSFTSPASLPSISQLAQPTQPTHKHTHSHHHHHHTHQQGGEAEDVPPSQVDPRGERRAARLAAFGNLLRSKGFVWVAGRDDHCAEWSSAGGLLRFGTGGPWYAVLPRWVGGGMRAWELESECQVV
jgi:G3E family GTPase